MKRLTWLRAAVLVTAITAAPIATAGAQDVLSPWDTLFRYGLSLLINDPVEGRRSSTGILRCLLGDGSAVDIAYIRVFKPTSPAGFNHAVETCRALQQRWNDEHPIQPIILTPIVLNPPAPPPGNGPSETPLTSGSDTAVKVIEFVTGVTPPRNETTVATLCAATAMCLSLYGGPKRPLAALAGRGASATARVVKRALDSLRVSANASGAGVAPAQIVRRIARGEKIADIVEEGKALTYTTGNEHALVSLTTGERVLVSGGERGIELDGLGVRRVLGHTHPPHLIPGGPSGPDFDALVALGQRSSYLFEGGIVTKFSVPVTRLRVP